MIDVEVVKAPGRFHRVSLDEANPTVKAAYDLVSDEIGDVNGYTIRVGGVTANWDTRLSNGARVQFVKEVRAA